MPWPVNITKPCNALAPTTAQNTGNAVNVWPTMSRTDNFQPVSFPKRAKPLMTEALRVCSKIEGDKFNFGPSFNPCPCLYAWLVAWSQVCVHFSRSDKDVDNRQARLNAKMRGNWTSHSPAIAGQRGGCRVFIAFLNLSGDKWLYRSVILIVLCPISHDTAFNIKAGRRNL